MVFSSPVFLFVFLPVTYLGYRLLPGLPLRNAWLTLASLVFFSFGQLPYLALLLLSVLLNYLFGLWLQSGEPHRRLAAGLAVTANLLLLGIFNASDYMLTLGVPALRIISLSFPFAAFGIVTSSVCQALGKGVLSLTVSVLRQLVLILPVAWLLGQGAGLNSVWLAFPFAEVFSFLLSAFFMAYLFRTIVRPLRAPESGSLA